MEAGHLNILVVDDDPAHVEAIRRSLEEVGMEAGMDIARTLEEYRKKAASRRPDIALMDLNLPDGSTLDILGSRPEDQAFPVVIMTSFGNEQIAVEAMRAGALDYIVKSPEAFVDIPRTLVRALREWNLLSERRRVEDTLKDQIEFVSKLLDTIPSPVFYKDTGGRYLGCNRAFEEFMGMPKQDIIGKTVLDLGQSVYAGKILEKDRELFDHPGEQMYEWKAINAAGFERDVIFNKATFTDSGGDVSGLIGMLLDITDRKRIEERLQLIQYSLDHAAVSAFWIDPEGRLLYVNDAACTDLGYDRDELAVLSIFDIDPGMVPESWKKHWDELKECGSLSFESQHLSKYGGLFPVEVSANYVKFGHKEYDLVFAWDVTEKKKAQEEVVRSVDFYLTLLQDFPSLVWRSDLTGKCDYFNRTWLDFTGRTLDEELGDGWVQGVHPEDLGRCVKYYLDHFHARESFSMEYRLRHHSGEYRWIVDIGRPFQDFDGDFAGFIGSCYDITERKCAEEEVRLNETRLRSLVNIHQHRAQTVQDFLDYTLNEAIQMTGSRIGYIYHYNEEKREFVLNTWSRDVMKECAVAEPLNIYQLEKTGIWGEAVRQRRPIVVNDFHAPDHHKKGYPEGHVELHKFLTVPIFSGDHIVAVVGVANKETDYHETDILQLTLLMDAVWKVVERKRVEGALSQSEERLSLATRGTGIGVWDYCIADDHLQWDDRMFELFGIGKEAFGGKLEDWSRCIPPEVLPRVVAELQAALKGKKEFSIEFPILTAEAGMRFLAGSAIVTRNEQGEPVRVVGINYDITERKQAEEGLRRAKDELEQANGRLKRTIEHANRMTLEAQAADRAKSEFLANMSHEIRTPMNGVMGMTDILLMGNLNDDQRKFARLIKTSAGSLLSIINEILDYSKIEAGRLEIERIPFDLKTAMDELDEFLSFRAQEKGLEFSTILGPGVQCSLAGDPGRLRQILLNLAGNAIKFTPKGGVALRVDPDREEEGRVFLTFTVSDSGIGIPEDKIASLFEPFTQEDTSTTRRFGGTGLGLTISKQLVELMGGRIDVESVLGEGSRFRFTIGFGKQDEPVERVRTPETGFEGRSILAADGNVVSLTILATVLKEWKFDVHEATNGLAALQMLSDMRREGKLPDIVIIDKDLPGTGGEELGKSIREDRGSEGIKLVMTTSSAATVDAARLEKVGFSAHLGKPLMIAELKECLHQVMDGQGDAIPAGSINRQASSGSRRKAGSILIVDDNDTNRLVAQAMLEMLGYRAVGATGGEECLRALQAEPFDIVLMDCHMPGMDGFEATARIREKLGKSITVIAMTATARREDRERCLEAGMDDYLAKPFVAGDLIAKIEKWLPGLQKSRPEKQEWIPAPGNRIFDKAHLVKRLLGNEEAAGKIAAAFLKDAKRLVSEVKKSESGGQAEKLVLDAHTLKGACGTVSAFELMNLASLIEDAARDGDIEKAGQHILKLDRRFEEAREAIEALQTGHEKGETVP